jgi:hypothetical protein
MYGDDLDLYASFAHTLGKHLSMFVYSIHSFPTCLLLSYPF